MMKDYHYFYLKCHALLLYCYCYFIIIVIILFFLLLYIVLLFYLEIDAYLSTPALSWHAALFMSKIEVDLISDI